MTCSIILDHPCVLTMTLLESRCSSCEPDHRGGFLCLSFFSEGTKGFSRWPFNNHIPCPEVVLCKSLSLISKRYLSAYFRYPGHQFSIPAPLPHCTSKYRISNKHPHSKVGHNFIEGCELKTSKNNWFLRMRATGKFYLGPVESYNGLMKIDFIFC